MMIADINIHEVPFARVFAVDIKEIMTWINLFLKFRQNI